MHLSIFCSAGLAYQQFVKDLRLSCGSDEIEYFRKKSDRSLCPRRPDFNRLYQTYCRERYGGRNGAAMFEHLNEVVESYLEENKESKIEFQAYNETDDTTIPFILVMMTDLMKRVHQMVRLENLYFSFINNVGNTTFCTRLPSTLMKIKNC